MLVRATTGAGAEPAEPAGAEPAEPFSLMGANAARLMGANAARCMLTRFTIFLSFHHHDVEHVDDVVLVLDAVLGDLVDGVLELLGAPDDLRDDLLDVMHVIEFLVILDLLVVRNDDFPLSPIPLSSVSILIVVLVLQ